MTEAELNQGQKPDQDPNKLSNPFEQFKALYATGLLIFSTIIVMALIFNGDTKVARQVHPALAFVLIWACLIWLNMVEGSQGSLVGLPPVDKELYKDTHPITYKICSVALKGDNLDRYLIGRQFMVLIIVFVTNQCGGPLPGSSVFGFPDLVIEIFLGSGLAMILMTAQMGQLNSQVNASHCMLDYINNHFATFTVTVAMGIEFSGLLHSCYLIQNILSVLSGKPIESKEPPRTQQQSLFFWGRVLVSLAILCFALAVTLQALFEGKTTMWAGVPNAISVILFFVFMSIVGLLEGMQIAFFAVTKLTKAEQGKAKFAMMTCNLLFKGWGANLSGFMIGRQLCVTLCFFVIARVTTLNVNLDAGDTTIFGVSNGTQEFFNTGLLGALVTTIIGSITWQLAASAFPLAFLSNPLVYVFLRICLFLEWTGICSGAWVLAAIHKKISGFRHDEYYIGTPEERAAKKLPDHDEELDVGAGHMYPGVPTMPHPVGGGISLTPSKEDEMARRAKIAEIAAQANAGDTNA